MEAYDLGVPTPLSSDLDLTVYVRNVNDYEPQFLMDEYNINFTGKMITELYLSHYANAMTFHYSNLLKTFNVYLPVIKQNKTLLQKRLTSVKNLAKCTGYIRIIKLQGTKMLSECHISSFIFYISSILSQPDASPQGKYVHLRPIHTLYAAAMPFPCHAVPLRV